MEESGSPELGLTPGSGGGKGSGSSEPGALSSHSAQNFPVLLKPCKNFRDPSRQTPRVSPYQPEKGSPWAEGDRQEGRQEAGLWPAGA